MIGMGSVVTRGVRDFHLVVGNPARVLVRKPKQESSDTPVPKQEQTQP